MDAATAVSRLEAKLGKKAADITDADLTPELAREVLGMQTQAEVRRCTEPGRVGAGGCGERCWACRGRRRWGAG